MVKQIVLKYSVNGYLIQCTTLNPLKHSIVSDFSGSWLFCFTIGGLSLVFLDIESINRDGAYSAACFIISGYFNPGYLLFAAGYLLLVSTAVIFFQVKDADNSVAISIDFFPDSSWAGKFAYIT